MCAETESALTSARFFPYCVIASSLHFVKSICLHLNPLQRDVVIILLNAQACLVVLQKEAGAKRRSANRLRVLLTRVRVCGVELFENVKPELLVRQGRLRAT